MLLTLSYPPHAGNLVLKDELNYFAKKDTKKLKALKKITEVFERVYAYHNSIFELPETKEINLKGFDSQKNMKPIKKNLAPSHPPDRAITDSKPETAYSAMK